MVLDLSTQTIWARQSLHHNKFENLSLTLNHTVSVFGVHYRIIRQCHNSLLIVVLDLSTQTIWARQSLHHNKFENFSLTLNHTVSVFRVHYRIIRQCHNSLLIVVLDLSTQTIWARQSLHHNKFENLSLTLNHTVSVSGVQYRIIRQ